MYIYVYIEKLMSVVNNYLAAVVNVFIIVDSITTYVYTYTSLFHIVMDIYVYESYTCISRE